MQRSTSMLISFTFCAKLIYKLSHEYVFLSVVSFLGSWSSKEFTHQKMNLPTQKQCPINMRTFNVIIGYSWKRVKPKTSTPHSGSHFSTLSHNEKLNIVTSIHELSTKMSELTSTLHHHNTRWDMKFTSCWHPILQPVFNVTWRVTVFIPLKQLIKLGN